MTVNELVEKYENDRQHYRSPGYNETQLRNDFLNPLFELLGWDIKNQKRKPTNEREVILEESLKVKDSGSTKKPDYTFRFFSERKFFLEAKKPNIEIQDSISAAKQIRRYGFSSRLKISVLSNFEHLVIYDCSVKVEGEDDHRTARVKVYHYSQYEKEFDELKCLIGRDAVYSGQFDDAWKNIEENINRFCVDDLFLEQINLWRELLGIEILSCAPDISMELLNDVVQRYLNSIIFLRVCEDRELELSESLLNISSERNVQALLSKFTEADKKYNAGLFQLYQSDKIINNIHSVFWQIIRELYYPESPYSFSVLSSEILGNIYEIFLSERLAIENHILGLEKKPDTVDKDVITTPTYIIREILKQTVVPFCRGKNDREILGMRIADIACGSGAFLLETFQLLNDLLIDYYMQTDTSRLVQIGPNSYKLPFELKKTILVNCIYGVDKDYNAVEAARFGLLLKLLEDETGKSISNQTPILPDLSNNIVFGNALIAPHDVEGIAEDEKRQINPFDFKNAKFDIIVGNPPYMKSEDMKRLTPMERPQYKKNFTSAYKQYDKYFLFIEKSMSLLKNNGYLGYIVPGKFTKVGAGKKLRHLLAQSGHLKRIISFGANQVFQSKTTYTCVLIIEMRQIESCDYYEVKNLSHWKINGFSKSDCETYPLHELEDDVWAFVPAYLKHIYDEINTKGIPLLQLLGKDNVFNGIQTSRNTIFIISPTSEDNRYIYFNNKGQSRKVERELTRPYYQTPTGKKDKDRLNTYRILEPNSRVIYPYKKLNNNVEVIREAELQEKFPETYSYFMHFKSNLLERDVSPPIESDDWYKFGRSQHLDRWDSPVKIVIGVNSMGDKYAIDFSRTFISSGGTAGYCGITVPKHTGYSIYYIQAVLNSKYMEWYSSLIGEIFRGGYIARGTKVLNRLPVRKINFSNAAEKQMHDGIVDVQQQLIKIYSEIDRNTGNDRTMIKLQRRFDELKSELALRLDDLYGFGSDAGLIPLIKELYR